MSQIHRFMAKSKSKRKRMRMKRKQALKKGKKLIRQRVIEIQKAKAG